MRAWTRARWGGNIEENLNIDCYQWCSVMKDSDSSIRIRILHTRRFRAKATMRAVTVGPGYWAAAGGPWGSADDLVESNFAFCGIWRSRWRGIWFSGQQYVLAEPQGKEGGVNLWR